MQLKSEQILVLSGRGCTIRRLCTAGVTEIYHVQRGSEVLPSAPSTQGATAHIGCVVCLHQRHTMYPAQSQSSGWQCKTSTVIVPAAATEHKHQTGSSHHLHT